MPEELKEGAPETAEESVGLAVPEISEGAPEVQQPSPATAGLTEERLKELLEDQKAALAEMIERRVQSTKDRRIGKLESKVDELLVLRQEVEAAGGWDPVISQQRQAEDWEARMTRIVDARLPRQPASQPVSDPTDAWRAEWNAESQKILDAASKLGIVITPEEYNAAMFGKKFKTPGDAYAALNQAIIRKGRGDDVTTAAVATEGGGVPRTPEPTTPKPFRQQLDEAKKKGDAEARKVLDAQWAVIEKDRAREQARLALEEAGVSPEELLK